MIHASKFHCGILSKQSFHLTLWIHFGHFFLLILNCQIDCFFMLTLMKLGSGNKPNKYIEFFISFDIGLSNTVCKVYWIYFQKLILRSINFHLLSYQKVRGSTQTGEVPSTYRCFKCHKMGHWIKNCPLNAHHDSPHTEVKRSTGIPRSFIDGMTRHFRNIVSFHYYVRNNFLSMFFIRPQLVILQRPSQSTYHQLRRNKKFRTI